MAEVSLILKCKAFIEIVISLRALFFTLSASSV